MNKNVFKSKKNIAIIFILMLITSLFILQSYANEGKFIEVGNMTISRSHHAATLLSDGQVLVTGGFSTMPKPPNPSYVSNTEIYNPKTGKFRPLNNMLNGRSNHTATLLNDSRVLIAGGKVGTDNLSSAEIYDPKTGKFTRTGSMHIGRSNHTATLLKDGRVLVIGGSTNFYIVDKKLSKLVKNPEIKISELSAEIYNPKTGTFSVTDEMHSGIVNKAVLLSNGKVLIFGKSINKERHERIGVTEIYDPITNKFTITNKTTKLITEFTATLLNNNKVLLAGNANQLPAYLYDINSNKFSEIKDTMEGKCSNMSCTAILLRNGKVLIVGTDKLNQEIYDPNKNEFIKTGKLNSPLYEQTATLLNNGNVLITGGMPNVSEIEKTHNKKINKYDTSSNAELYKFSK